MERGEQPRGGIKCFCTPGGQKKGWSKKESPRVVQKRTVRPGGQKKAAEKAGGRKCFEKAISGIKTGGRNFTYDDKNKGKAGFFAKKLEKCRNGARKKLESGLLRKG